MKHHSVTVVGAGLVGATAALGLADLGFEVTVIERAEPQIQSGRLGMDIRNVALSPASSKMLDQLGAWQGLRHAPYHRMVVWEQWGSGQVEFDAAEVALPQLGWLIEVSGLLRELWRRLSEHPNVSVLLGELSDVQVEADLITLSLSSGEILPSEFVIAADGANSLVRKALPTQVTQRPMDQVALATVVRTQRPHENAARQRFLSGGPLAFLPGPQTHLCSIVWSAPASESARRIALSDDAFCVEIGDAIEHRLGAVEAVDARVSFPLTQQRVEDCAPHPRALLVGDAMRVIHPLAGLGVNLGLEDVSELLRVAQKQDDLTKPGLWKGFARARARRSEMAIAAMAGLRGIYTSADPLLGLLRQAGIRSFNALAVVKRQVMRQAMGLGAR